MQKLEKMPENFRYGLPVTEVWSVLAAAVALKKLQRGIAAATPEALADILAHTNHQPLVSRILNCVENALAAAPEKYPSYQRVLCGACFKRIVSEKNICKIMELAQRYSADDGQNYALAWMLKRHPNLPRSLKEAAAQLEETAQNRCRENTGSVVLALQKEDFCLPWAGNLLTRPREPKNDLVYVINEENYKVEINGFSTYDTLRLAGKMHNFSLNLLGESKLPRVIDASEAPNVSIDLSGADLAPLDEIIFPKEVNNIRLENARNLPPRLLCNAKASAINFSSADMANVEQLHLSGFVYGSVCLAELRNLGCPLDLSSLRAQQGINLNGTDFKNVPLFIPPQEGQLYMENCLNLPETLEFKNTNLDILSISTADNSLKRIILPRVMSKKILRIGKGIDVMFYNPDAPDLRILRPESSWKLYAGTPETIDASQYDKVELPRVGGVLALFNIKNCPPLDFSDHEENVSLFVLCGVELGDSAMVKFPPNTEKIEIISTPFPRRHNIAELNRLEELLENGADMPHNYVLECPPSLKKLRLAGYHETWINVNLSACKGLETLEFKENTAGISFILPLEFKDKRAYPPQVAVQYAAPDGKTVLDLRHMGKAGADLTDFKFKNGNFQFRNMQKYEEVLMPDLLRNIDFGKADGLPRKIDFSRCHCLKTIEGLNLSRLSPFPDEVVFPAHFRDDPWVQQCQNIGIKVTVAAKECKGLLNYFKQKLSSR